MDLIFKVTDNKYDNIKEIIKNEFKISNRLYLKLKKYNKIYLNRRNKLSK